MARKELEQVVRRFMPTRSASENEHYFRFDLNAVFQKLVDDAGDKSELLDRTNVQGPLAAFPFCAFTYFSN